MEKVAHEGPARADGGAIGPFIIYASGNGAMSAAARILDCYGDVFVDTARRQAIGIDGRTAVLENVRVMIHGRFKHLQMYVVFADGRRATVSLADGCGRVSLECLAKPR